MNAQARQTAPPSQAPETPLRAVLFDMDGVLCDSEPLIRQAAMTMFAERGLTVAPEDFAPFVGTGENRYIGGVAERYGFPIDLAEAKLRTYDIYLELIPNRLRAFPGARECVTACRREGFRLAVASSADRVKVAANLESIGLPPSQWDAVLTAEDVEARKPDPDLFLAAATRLDVDPASCVVIEDAPSGIQAALAAGMPCIAVAQSFPEHHLQRATLVRPTIASVTIADICHCYELGSGH